MFLLIGVLGLLWPGGMSMVAETERAPRLPGLFPVNLLHNLVHLAFSVWGVRAARRREAARSDCRIGAVIYAVLAGTAFISDSRFGRVPIGSHDVWLHPVLAAGLATSGWCTARRTCRRTPDAGRRRRGSTGSRCFGPFPFAGRGRSVVAIPIPRIRCTGGAAG